MPQPKAFTMEMSSKKTHNSILIPVETVENIEVYSTKTPSYLTIHTGEKYQ
jgi:hypothetical protein